MIHDTGKAQCVDTFDLCNTVAPSTSSGSISTPASERRTSGPHASGRSATASRNPAAQSVTIIPPLSPLPEHRVEGIGRGAEDADDLVVPAHDGPDDVARLLRAPERGLPATPDHRQPVARQDQFRADRDASEEAVEVGQAHAVFGRVVRHQARVQGIEIDGAGLGDRVGHGGAGPWRWRKVARAHGRRARRRRIVGERARGANRPPAPTPVHRRPPPHGGGPASRDARPSSGVPCQRSNAGRCGCRGPLSPWRRATLPAPPPRAHRLRCGWRHRPASRPS